MCVFGFLYMYNNTKNTVSSIDYIYLALAGMCMAGFRIFTFLSVNNSNSSVYSNFSNIDILLFWIVGYLRGKIKSNAIIDVLLIASIILAAFLSNCLMFPNNNSLVFSCTYAIFAMIFSVSGISLYEMSKEYRLTKCTIMFTNEFILLLSFCAFGNEQTNNNYYNNYVYLLIISNVIFSSITYYAVDNFGGIFLSIGLTSIIFWTYIYAIIFDNVQNIILTSMSTVLLFILICVYNLLSNKNNNENNIQNNNQIEMESLL